VESILNAAARVFIAQGFAGASVEMIADCAKTSVGSIYQFFPSKSALFEALTQRCLERSRQLFQQLPLQKMAEQDMLQTLGKVVDWYTEHELKDPVFRAVWLNLPFAPNYQKSVLQLRREYILTTQSLLSTFAPHVSGGQTFLVATMIVEVISAALFISVREDPMFATMMMAETKTLLQRYLAPYLVRPHGIPGLG
jgi:AcrR family transcriptional regulator